MAAPLPPSNGDGRSLKFLVDAKLFNATLGSVLGVVPSRSTSTVFTNVLLDARDCRVTLTGTDGIQRLETHCPASIDSPGTIVVAAQALADNCKFMEGQITFEVTGDDLIIDDGNGLAKLRLSTVTPAQFPLGDQGLRTLCRFKVIGAALSNILKFIDPAIIDEAKAIPKQIDGAVFDLLGDDLGLFGYDRHSFACTNIQVSDVEHMAAIDVDSQGKGAPDSRFVATLMEKCAKHVMSLCKSLSEVEVSFTHGRGSVVSELFRYSFALTTWAGKLPWRNNNNYIATSGFTCAVDAEAMAKAVQRATACVRHDGEALGYLGVSVSVKDGAMHVRGTSSVGESFASCPVQQCSTDKEQKFLIAGAFMLRHLRSLSGELNLTLGGNGVVMRQDNRTVSIAYMVANGGK